MVEAFPESKKTRLMRPSAFCTGLCGGTSKVHPRSVHDHVPVLLIEPMVLVAETEHPLGSTSKETCPLDTIWVSLSPSGHRMVTDSKSLFTLRTSGTPACTGLTSHTNVQSQVINTPYVVRRYHNGRVRIGIPQLSQTVTCPTAYGAHGCIVAPRRTVFSSKKNDL